MIEYFTFNPPPQNTHLIQETERVFGGIKRSLTMSHFFHNKQNGEKIQRKWLVLSASTKMLFCWVCKLTYDRTSPKGQLITGFCDWKHASTRLKEHENSTTHKQSMMNFSIRNSVSQRVDTSLVQQFEEETKYWTLILTRVVAVVKFFGIARFALFW